MKAMGGEYHETILRLRNEGFDFPSHRPGDAAEYLDASQWNGRVARLSAKLGGGSRPTPPHRLSGLEETTEGFLVTAVLAEHDREITTATALWPKVPFDIWWAQERGIVPARVEDIAGPFTLASPAITQCAGGMESWTPTSQGTNVPEARASHTAVWTGTEMIVWGYGNTGGRYKPSTNTWSPTSTGANVPEARYQHTAVWTGTEMIVWGGWGFGHDLNTGGRYKPSTDTWTPTSTGTNVPEARSGHTAVWTGTEMIVWGAGNTGGRYKPSTDTWTPTSTGANVPVARSFHVAVWTDEEMIVWGGYGSYVYWGGAYNPVANSWRFIPDDLDSEDDRTEMTAVWTGWEMLFFGGYRNSFFFGDGFTYSPMYDIWSRVTSTGTNRRADHTAVWTGTEMIVWGGADNTEPYLLTGDRYCACPSGTIVYRDEDRDGYGNPSPSARICNDYYHNHCTHGTISGYCDSNTNCDISIGNQPVPNGTDLLLQRATRESPRLVARRRRR